MRKILALLMVLVLMTGVVSAMEADDAFAAVRAERIPPVISTAGVTTHTEYRTQCLGNGKCITFAVEVADAPPVAPIPQNPPPQPMPHFRVEAGSTVTTTSTKTFSSVSATRKHPLLEAFKKIFAPRRTRGGCEL